MRTLGEDDDLKCEEARRVCRGCLAGGGGDQLHDSDLAASTVELREFCDLTGLPAPADGVVWLCALCRQQLRRCGRFRARCRLAAMHLTSAHGAHNQQTVNSLDTKHLQYNLMKTETEILSIEPNKAKHKRNWKRKFIKTDIQHIDIQPQVEVFVDIKDAVKKQESDDEDFELIPHDTTLDTTLDTSLVTKNSISTLEPIVEPLVYNEIEKSDIDYDDYKPSMSDSSSLDEDDDDDDDDEYTLSDVIKKDKASVKGRKESIKKSSKVKRNKKQKAVDNEEDKNKGKRKKGESVERSEDKKLIKEIGETFKKMWRWKTDEKMNIFRMFEKIYEESIAVKNGESGGCQCERKHGKGTVCVKQELRVFLDYVKKLSDLYNVDVEFLSVAKQKAEIESRLSSAEYLDAQHKCELCAKIFNFHDTYNRHMASHTVSPGDVECEICRYRFKRHASLMSHIHTMHSKKLRCRECGFVNRTWNLAKEHYDFHQGIAPVCHLCGKNFTEKKHYLMHLRQVHRAQVATTLCLLCGDSFNGPTGLRIHMDRSHRQAAKCGRCDSWFLSAEMLAAHTDSSAGACHPGLSACPMCGANFSTEELMWKHHDEQHIQEYRCDECNKSYAGLRKYKWHVENKHAKTKRGDGPGKPRKRPSDYKGNKNFVCDVCGKDDFPFLSSLRFHQRKHTDEKPHECSVCRKAFKEKLNLKVHMTIHTDERRYQCPHCPKAFRQFSHRTVHIRTHTKEKPYACSICGKQFGHRSVMLEHSRTVHEGLPPRKRTKHQHNTM